MRTGFAFLLLAYVLSQFYRAFLAVLAPALGRDLGASAEDLALASGVWFAGFAAAQIPIGVGLDRIGPRRTAAAIFGAGAGGGAALFALAQSPAAIVWSMALIGIGCGPALMASFYIFARVFPPAAFASLGGLMIGLGSLGNLAGAAPMAWAADAFGWRATVWGLAALSVTVGAGVWAFVRDPEPSPPAEGRDGGLMDLLRVRAFWLLAPLMFIHYAPAAGVRGLWAGPYLEDVFGLDASGIGLVAFGMGVAMILGNFAYGPADRIFGSRKRVLVLGNLAAAAALVGLGLWPAAGLLAAAALLALLGFFGSSFPLMMAHARGFYPPHLIGRGVTFSNLLAMGGVGLLQVVSGLLYGASESAGASPEAAYGALFLFFALLLVIGVAVYAFAEDRPD